MSSTITATRRSAASGLPPVSSCPSYRSAFPARRRSRRRRSNCRRSRSPRPPTRTGPAPNRPTMKDRHRAASCRAAPPTGTQPAHGDRPTSQPKASRKAADGSGGRQFSGIVGTASTVITAEEIAHSPAQTLQEIIAQAPGVQLTSLFGGVNGAKTSVDLRGFGAFATSNTLVLINGRRLNDIDMAGVDFSTIPRDSIERIEITRGNSGAVLYGDNAIGGVINIVLKNGVGGPPVAMRAEAGVGSFNQRMACECLGRDQLRAVVDVVLRQRHQVRRLSRQQRARPAQRRRQPQLHHARPQGVPDRDRRRPEARIARRPHRRSLDRRQRTGHRPPRRRHAVRLRQPAGRQRHRRLHQDARGTASTSSSMAACGTRRQQGGFFGAVPFASPFIRFNLCRQPLADLVDHAATERQERDVRGALADPDRHRLLRCDVPPGRGRVQGRCRRSTPTICRSRRWPATGSKPSACCRPPISPMAPGCRTPA